ncbi:MAG: ATP-binding protein, partial [Acetobacteraceae bacterium]
MDPLGPFEPAPRLAVAVSGGPDSLALALLADSWVRARGGAILALIVDHGLRVEAAREAEEARALLASRGIASSILRAAGLRPGT